MAVPVTITDLTTTVASNSPQGSDAIGTNADDYIRALSAILKESGATLYTATGTDTITFSTTPTFSAYASGQRFFVKAAAANTGAVTVNINALGAKNVLKSGATALSAGDIPAANAHFLIEYDGTQFQLLNPVYGLFGAGTVSLPAITLNGDTDSGLYQIGANNLGVAVSGAKVLDIASTGLSVTGTLSATGDVTASGGNLLLSSGGTIPLRISGATTGSSVARIQNTGGDAIFGQESSAGNALISGCSAYDTIIRGPSGLAFSANAGSAMQMRLSSTGLAVTGTLSATGTLSTTGLITSTAAAQSALFNNAAGSYATWQYNGTSLGDIGTANHVVSGGATTDFAITSRAGNLILGSGTTTRVTVSSTGLAVTGTLSATGTSSLARIDQSNGSIDFASLGNGSTSWQIGTQTAGKPLDLFIGGSVIATVSTTGLAVTGTTSTTTGMAVGGATAGAGGIAFPASAVAVADVNTLDDYEEGTFSPGISFGGGTTGITYNTQAGAYTKIGNRVFCTGKVELSAKGSSTGSALITGLPFTVASGNANLSPPALRITAITFADYPTGYAVQTTTTLALEECTNAGTLTDLSDADFSNSSAIVFSFNYAV